VVIVCRDDFRVPHDGSEGVSPEGWLPDRVSVRALTGAFPPNLVDRVVATTDTRELRRRLLPARLVVYFVLGVVAVPGSQLRLRAGDGQAGRRPVSAAAASSCSTGSSIRRAGSRRERVGGDGREHLLAGAGP
jgi:hypothetical protein